jgi:hypothetical protein
MLARLIDPCDQPRGEDLILCDMPIIDRVGRYSSPTVSRH